MRSNMFFTGLFIALSMISSLSFAECGMDRKLELLKDLNEILEEKALIYRDARNDKKAERRIRKYIK